MIPSLFIGHGAPSLIFDNNEYTEFLKSYSKNISKPKAIIIFSAHFESDIQTIGAAKHYDMIYDFYGFPEELYHIRYNSGSDIELTSKIHNLLKANHIESILDYKRGIDHGAWTMLKLMYPEIDVPVITMSVNTKLSNEELYNIGRALESLRSDDILIIASGGIVHNLGKVKFDNSKNIDSWALVIAL